MILGQSKFEDIKVLAFWTIARLILQRPRSASQVCGYIDTGLKPIKARFDSKCVLFTWEVIHGKRSSMMKQVMETVLRNLQNP